VAEARGEARPAPPSVSIDVPGDAHLPKDYVEAEDARLEAYRRLAAAVSLEDVDDIGAEWADRYGPLPVPAEGLLSVGRLRATALARGIGEVAMSSVRPGGTQRPVVRLSPVTLPASAQVRLRRVAPGATYREDLAQLLLPVPVGVPAAEGVRGVIEELLPVAQGDSNSGEGSL
jgi:transcription-repair coupling factor (superfamily II helicase)